MTMLWYLHLFKCQIYEKICLIDLMTAVCPVLIAMLLYSLLINNTSGLKLIMNVFLL